MGCESSKMALDENVQKCIDFLKRPPDLKLYENNENNQSIIKKAYQSQLFGGSVFLPIGTLDTGKWDKKNNLEEDIKKLEI